MQSNLLCRISSKLFSTKLDPIFKKINFLDLDMEFILNESLVHFNDFSEKMTFKV